MSDVAKIDLEQTRYRLLYDLSCAFAARIENDELFPFVVNKCCEVFDAEGASVLLLDSEKGELYFPFTAPKNAVTAHLQKARLPCDKGIAGLVVSSGKGVHIEDVQAHPSFFSVIDEKTGFITRNVLCAPLRTSQGVIGVLQIVNRRGGGAFADDDLAFLDALAGGIAVAIDNARLFGRVKASEEHLRVQVGALRRDIAHRDRFTDIIGSSASISEVIQLMESAAASPITVLIQGETGTGKELVARGIHHNGPRGDSPFLAVNCAAVSETLLESELFGHIRGSFTGATQDHRGLFEAAEGGTIFLDEVGEMPASMQAKLLRVLQEGEIIPVGDTTPRKVDVRVISATNRNLEQEVSDKNFREDLYYRLAVFPIPLPPLRDRADDIPLLCDHLLRKHKRREGSAAISNEAMELLLRDPWPGNIRELENELERASVLAGEGRIAPEHLSGKRRGADTTRAANTQAGAQALAVQPTGSGNDPTPLREARARFEAEYIRKILEENDRNVSQTARVLGLSRVMLQKKMKEYGLRDE